MPSALSKYLNRGRPTYRARRGRPPRIELTEWEAQAIRELSMIVSTPGYKRATQAILAFTHSTLCRPSLRAEILAVYRQAQAKGRRPSWPIALYRAAHFSECEYLHFFNPQPRDISAN